jgi:hypothetical protein
MRSLEFAGNGRVTIAEGTLYTQQALLWVFPRRVSLYHYANAKAFTLKLPLLEFMFS